jgi:hypothetical protein
MKTVPAKLPTRETRAIDPATAAAAAAFGPDRVAPPSVEPASAITDPPPTPTYAPSPSVAPVQSAIAKPPDLGLTASTHSLNVVPPITPLSAAPTAQPPPPRPPVTALLIDPVSQQSSVNGTATPARPKLNRVGERQRTENKTTCFPDDADKARLRRLKYEHKIAEAFVVEDAIALYLANFTDAQIVARLSQANKAGPRRPFAFVEVQ